MSTHAVAWFFALGWAAQRASTPWRKVLVLLLGLLLIPGFFDHVSREVVIGVGFLLLLLVPRVPVPRPLARVVGLIASASLYIYLTHYVLIPGLLDHLPPLVVTGIGLLLGVLSWLVVERCAALLVRLRARGRAGGVRVDVGARVGKMSA